LDFLSEPELLGDEDVLLLELDLTEELELVEDDGLLLSLDLTGELVLYDCLLLDIALLVAVLLLNILAEEAVDLILYVEAILLDTENLLLTLAEAEGLLLPEADEDVVIKFCS
jgi:hypothetical protein